MSQNSSKTPLTASFSEFRYMIGKLQKGYSWTSGKFKHNNAGVNAGVNKVVGGHGGGTVAIHVPMACPMLCVQFGRWYI